MKKPTRLIELPTDDEWNDEEPEEDQPTYEEVIEQIMQETGWGDDEE